VEYRRLNYYERHIGDYLKDTAHLSLLEHGVYTRLMDVYYTREGAIPAADVARLIGARSRDERAALHAVLAEFFELVDDSHRQERCEREISRYQDKQAKAKRSAEARWSAGKTQSEGNANASADAMRSHSEGNAPRARPQTPDTRHQYSSAPPTGASEKRSAPLPCPDGVDAQVWSDWLQLRKAKKAPVTDTVLKGAASEAAKAGMSLDAFLRIWCSRGSQGLQADWLKPQERTQSPTDDRSAKVVATQRLLGIPTPTPQGDFIDG
jgi:uncharacterized protein YdaU (DUF1376 family)